MLEKALAAKANDKSKIKRNLHRYLCRILSLNTILFFVEVAILYAFRELETRPEEIPDNRLESIKNMITGSGDGLNSRCSNIKLFRLCLMNEIKINLSLPQLILPIEIFLKLLSV